MKLSVLCGAVVLLSGCQFQLADTGSQTAPAAELLPEQVILPGNNGNYLPAVAARVNTKPLTDYAADLALQLMMSMHYTPPQQAIAISSLVWFDHQLTNSNALGNQLAEHLYVHLQRLGVSVADIKVGRQIRVTAQGDFALSRGRYLDAAQDVRYVLTGTLLQDAGGTVVNVRVVHLQHKTVIATGQVHIPDAVLNPAAATAQYIASP
ncbi:TolB-like protein [Rheinheimera pacifica]|uniref:FlgO family outer membrane protein n=1 Tax=Rheinheimera pacifica TaxID=173990 RepID=UPI00216962CB|nr:FlgO family outer membrane protein [Rheinheimera pacifica]MCS4309237.1 TolB-like protein [Rheinheimera pacifica]